MSTSKTAAAPESLLASPDQLSQNEITAEIQHYHAAAAEREAAGETVAADRCTTSRRTARASCATRRRTRGWSTPRRSSCGRPRSGSAMSPPSSPTSRCSTRGEPQGERITVQGRLLDSWGRPVAQPADRDVAGQRRRPLHPPARPASRAARPELHRRRPHGHQRRRRVQVHDDQAGAVPVEEPRQRVAPRAHPLLASSARASRSASSRRCTSRATRCSRSTRSTTRIHRQKDRDRLIGAYNHDLTVPEFSMGYEWDIVVDGPDATWFEPEGEH